jgi:hypothetical protein
MTKVEITTSAGNILLRAYAGGPSIAWQWAAHVSRQHGRRVWLALDGKRVGSLHAGA